MKRILVLLFAMSCGRALDVGSLDAGTFDAGLPPLTLTDARDVETNGITLRTERKAWLIGTGFATGTTATLVLNPGQAEKRFELVIDAAQSASQRLAVVMPSLSDVDGIALGDSGPALIRVALPSTGQTASKGVSIAREPLTSVDACVAACGDTTSCEAPGLSCYSDGQAYCSSCIASCHAATRVPVPTISHFEEYQPHAYKQVTGVSAGSTLVVIGTNLETQNFRSVSFNGHVSPLTRADPEDPSRRHFVLVPRDIPNLPASFSLLVTTHSGCTAAATVTIGTPWKDEPVLGPIPAFAVEESELTLTGTNLVQALDVRIGELRATQVARTETSVTFRVPNFSNLTVGQSALKLVSLDLHNGEQLLTSTFGSTAITILGGP